MKRNLLVPLSIAAAVAVAGAVIHADFVSADFNAGAARDPGVRVEAPGAGQAIAGLNAYQSAYFASGLADFAEAEDVAEGLGPRMNLDSCGGCHAYPAAGGTSPFVNPQVAFARKNGGTDSVPSFITTDGPVREARFVRNPDGTADGGVHALFTITNRTGAQGCTLTQPDFAQQVANRNVIFRIPTPLFGTGLIEQIPDSAIVANQATSSSQKVQLGIRGRPNFHLNGRTITGQTNRNGNDGTIARFGWKAQNKSLLMFSGEAYNVEMGITNDLFPTERDETLSCQFAPVPNGLTNMEAATSLETLSGIENFTNYMRFLAPPSPSSDTPGGAQSIARGRTQFSNIGCAYCHTPSFTTGNSKVPALRYQQVNLYSDLLIHDMGPGLSDGVSQGQAGPREFRTAPLWGLGQRIFFLHDGRTRDLLEAIRAHQSGSTYGGDASEANRVIYYFNNLQESQKQDILNFLRSL